MKDVKAPVLSARLPAVIAEATNNAPGSANPKSVPSVSTRTRWRASCERPRTYCTISRAPKNTAAAPRYSVAMLWKSVYAVGR